MKIFTLIILAFVALSHASWPNRPGSGRSSSEVFENSNEWMSEQMELTLTGTDELQFRSAASRLPQSQSFKQKIRQRLAGSNAFAASSEMRRKLIDFADQKLEKCKSPSGLELDRHCVGRATGQIMQLIAAVENNAQGGF